MIGGLVHGDVVPRIAETPGLDARARVRPVRAGEPGDQILQAGALGGAGGDDVEELLVADHFDLPAPALGQVGDDALACGVIAHAHGNSDEAVPGHLLGRHGNEHLEDRRDLVVGVRDDVVGLQRGSEDREPVDPLQGHDDLVGQAVGQEAGGQHAVVAVGEHRPGERDRIVEDDAERLEGVAGGEDRLAGVHHQQVPGRPPPSHGLAVGGRDFPVEQNGAVQVGGDELGRLERLKPLGHVCAPRIPDIRAGGCG